MEEGFITKTKLVAHGIGDTSSVLVGKGRSSGCTLELLSQKGSVTQTRRRNSPFLRARVLAAVEVWMGLSRRGVLLIPRDRLILVISGTWVSFPRPYAKNNVSASSRVARRVSETKAYHVTKLSLRVLPPSSGGVGVRKGGFITSSDAVWITSSQGVPEPPTCPGGGGGAMNATV